MLFTKLICIIVAGMGGGGTQRRQRQRRQLGETGTMSRRRWRERHLGEVMDEDQSLLFGHYCFSSISTKEKLSQFEFEFCKTHLLGGTIYLVAHSFRARSFPLLLYYFDLLPTAVAAATLVAICFRIVKFGNVRCKQHK